MLGDPKVKFVVCVLALAVAVGLACGAEAAPASGAAAPPRSAESQPKERNKALEIATQPARDVGVARTEIPDVLAEASEDAYSLKGLKTCKQLTAEIVELSAALGPDFQQAAGYKENRATKLAEAGGKTVINSFIPFRGLVREVSGAATADRKLRAAEQAGFARRGFIRGVYTQRGCRPRM